MVGTWRGSRGLSAIAALDRPSSVRGPRAQVTERGVCSLAQRCRGLHTLNLTGCHEIGQGGLSGLIQGVGEAYVKEAKTFFGFIPRRRMVHRRVRGTSRHDGGIWPGPGYIDRASLLTTPEQGTAERE